MEKDLKNAILFEAKEHAIRYQNYHNYLHIEYTRNRKRLKVISSKDVKIPDEWKIDKKFNPFYVIKHCNQISKSISKKILTGCYSPEYPYLKKIPKLDGTEREISVYQLPDAAVSDKFYHNLIKKNKHRFSHFSYAYRNDKNLHFAIQDIANELKNSERIFIAEFDFSDFFGSIQHQYLFTQLDKNCFSVSDTERKIIEVFLNGRSGVGIPQGLSISLFLANLICWQLDRALEDEGLRFARYADDTIIWTKDYNKICKAFEIINQFSKSTGISINAKKSEGISLLQKKGLHSEFANTKYHIEFLGYKVSNETIGIKDNSVLKIKKHISYLLYKSLIQPIKSSPLNNKNIPSKNGDKDFLSALMQIRRYLYGNLSEATLKKYLNGTYSRLNFKGLMSFYPIINDDCQMKDLDKWLISTVLNVLKMRKKLFRKAGFLNLNIFPFNLSSKDIVISCKNQMFNHKKGLYQLPSFLRIYLAIQKGVNTTGVESVMNKKIIYYED